MTVNGIKHAFRNTPRIGCLLLLILVMLALLATASSKVLALGDPKLLGRSAESGSSSADLIEITLTVRPESTLPLYNDLKVFVDVTSSSSLPDQLGVILFYSHDNASWHSQVMNVIGYENEGRSALYEAVIAEVNQTGTLYLYAEAREGTQVVATTSIVEVTVVNGVRFDIEITPEDPTMKDIIQISVMLKGDNLLTDSVTLHYRPSSLTGSEWINVTMTQDSQVPNKFTALIGPFPNVRVVYYFIQVTNTTGSTFQSSERYIKLDSGGSPPNDNVNGLERLLFAPMLFFPGDLIILTILVVVGVGFVVVSKSSRRKRQQQ